jgi:hypothetical protein
MTARRVAEYRGSWATGGRSCLRREHLHQKEQQDILGETPFD